MMEITINGIAYPFAFNMGFMKEINKLVETPLENIKGKSQHVGLRYYAGSLMDGDVEALLTVLEIANKYSRCESNLRIAPQTLESYIDDESTDIDALFEEVMDFLKKSNACRKEVLRLEKAYKEELEKQ